MKTFLHLWFSQPVAELSSEWGHGRRGVPAYSAGLGRTPSGVQGRASGQGPASKAKSFLVLGRPIEGAMVVGIA